MIRANIYSIDTLDKTTRDAVHDGIGMVAVCMGQELLADDLRVNLPLNSNGNVNPLRVGFAKLDKLVELHLMAVPLDKGEDERLGIAGIGSGWAFVDIGYDDESIVRTTTAHEVAHAFGFVRPDSKHQDPESPYHCCDGSCIMHKRATIEVVQSIVRSDDSPQSRIRRIFNKKAQKHEVQTAYNLKSQFDLCTSCKVDLRDNGEEEITKLRTNRLFASQKIR